jgi:hypothetical protein
LLLQICLILIFQDISGFTLFLRKLAAAANCISLEIDDRQGTTVILHNLTQKGSTSSKSSNVELDTIHDNEA